MTLSLAFMSPALAPPRSIGKREASAPASPSRGSGKRNFAGCRAIGGCPPGADVGTQGTRREESLPNACASSADGTVTLRCREREASATQELSGLCDRVPPRGHRRGAKRTVGLG